MKFSIIAAVDQNGGIGKNGKIPWTLPTDMKFFQKTTIGNEKNAVIMGRTTWESIPGNRRPLKNRLNIVLTHDENYKLPKGILRAETFEKALVLAQKHDCEKIFIIGGAKTYAQALADPRCTEIYVTEVLESFDCDAFFPKIDALRFKKTSESEVHEENNIKFKFVIYKHA